MKDSEKQAEVTFEVALGRLESIVQELEDGPSDLEDALKRYEEGVQLAKSCIDRLAAAELRVQELALSK